MIGVLLERKKERSSPTFLSLTFKEQLLIHGLICGLSLNSREYCVDYFLSLIHVFFSLHSPLIVTPTLAYTLC